jgi:hypothetical protein
MSSNNIKCNTTLNSKNSVVLKEFGTATRVERMYVEIMNGLYLCKLRHELFIQKYQMNQSSSSY